MLLPINATIGAGGVWRQLSVAYIGVGYVLSA